MTRTLTTSRAAALLLSASTLALASMPAAGADVLYSSNGATEVKPGERVVQTEGVTQIKLDNGSTLSFVDNAEYTIEADGSITLHSGGVTVTGGDSGNTVIRMPDGAEGTVGGSANSGVFNVDADGKSTGNTLTGDVMVKRGRNERTFNEGEFWASAGRNGLRQTVSNGTQATPQAEPEVQVADVEEEGPLGAVQNGQPVSLGADLAAAGASSDIVGAANRVEAAAQNPALETFPSGDLALLVEAAAGLENFNGGTPFPQAQADIIRAYLGFLADGGAGAEFLTSYAGFLTQYLDLIRAGGVPSNFQGASLADINAFLTYRNRLGALGQLDGDDLALAQRYLAFIGANGNPDAFAGTFTDLIEQYFAFVRGGGDPTAFTGATQAVLDDYIAFLNASGIAGQLSLADRTLLDAYLSNNGLAFANTYRAALDTYFDFLASGQLPSDFSATDLAILQNYLEVLEAAGLTDAVLGAQAGFFEQYLDFLQDGGNPDEFAGLNANIFTGYAAALETYYNYLLEGGLPSEYEPLTQAQIAQFVAELQAQGATGNFLDDLAGFYTDYAAFLAGGGNPDIFTGLPVLNLPAFADALNAYAAFLQGGGLPTGFTGNELQTLANYVTALENAGELDQRLGANAPLIDAYFAFLAGGGSPDLFADLPLYASYVDALGDYYAFLLNGGLPADFTDLTQAQIQAFIAALGNAGGLNAQLGDLGGFFGDYFAFVAAGNDPARFADLPVYSTYVADLNAYFAFLANGGLPADFSGLSQQVIQQYLAALSNVVGGLDQFGTLDAFADDYAAFVLGGGNPAQFAGLPIYGTYVDALNAYFDFLEAGGLPADFTGLSQQVIAQYLGALSNVVGGLDAFGELDVFADDYAAFVLGGGDPARFAGLPIYADYVAALNQYFAFLAGGGLPGDFTGLDAATVDAYLAALNNVVGGLDAFGQLNGNFDAYIDFLLGGGNPAEFAGLPVYGDYVAALNAYFAFLAGGGLPADYVVLDQATIQAYLAALSGVTGGLDAFGNLDAFFDAYAAFVLGGGDPAEFAGLPVYADYLAAVAQFYAFLIEGNLPSEFTALDQATIQAYLAALQGAGLLGANFNGEILTFFNDYLAFLAGGGVPDQFGDLPGQLDGTFANAALFAVSRNGFQTSTQASAEVEPDGQITSFTFSNNATTDYAATGDTARERGRVGDILAWTRYERGASAGGVTNFNTHLLAGELAVNVPASGLVSYNLIGGTEPTDAFGEAGSTGFFTGELAIAFGAQPQIGMNFEIYAGARGWSAETFGGAANAASGGINIDNDNRFALSLATNGIQGDACAEGCGTTVTGGLFGEGASHVGLTYFLQDSPGSAGQSLVNGVAIFSQGGTAIDGIGTRPAQPDVTLTGQSVAYANKFIGDDVYVDVSATYNSDGFPVGYSAANGDDALTIGTASLFDQGKAGDVIAWARWADGTPGGSYFGDSNLDPVGPNGGYHIIAGDILTNMPASGAVEYDIIGFTTPTRHDESTSTGGVTGGAAVVFGTNPVAAFDLDVTSGAEVFNVFTTGKLDNPDQSTLMIRPDGMFHTLGTINDGVSRNAVFVESAADFCAGTNGCAAFIEGFLAGDAASHMGLAYSIRDNRIPNKFIDGSVAFAKGDAIDLGGGNTLDNQALTFLNLENGREIYDRRFTQVTYDETTGAPIGFNLGPALDPQIGGAELVDAGESSDGLLGWGRWRNGTTTGTFYGDENLAFGAQGLHIFAGTFPNALPTEGLILYDLIGSTTPTLTNDTTGTLDSAQAVVAFGTQAKLGLDFSVSADGSTYRVNTPGGLDETATNGLNVTATNIFGLVNTSNNGGLEISGTGSICATSTCRVDVRGAFYGDGSATPNIGLAYSIGEMGALRVYGTFALGPNGTYTPGNTVDLPLEYMGGFDTSGDVLSLIRVGGFEANGLHTPVLNDDGELARTTDDWFSAGNGGSYFDIGGDALGVIGRFGGANILLDGRAFNGVPLDAGAHYALLAPFTGALPTSITIEYDLLAATRPTFSDGAFGPGSFDGDLTVQYDAGFVFSTFTGSVEMTESDGLHTYAFNFTDIERTPQKWVDEGAVGFSTDVTGTGRACPTQGDCQVKVILGGGGTNGTERVGVVYEIVDVNAPASIEGAALYGEPGTYPNNGGGSGDLTFESNRVVAYAGQDVGIDSRSQADVAYDNSGRPIGFIRTLNDFTRENERPTIGDASVAEGGSAAGGAISWARWADGTTGGRYFADQDGFVLGPDQGFHVAAATRATNLPTSGTVAYTLAGATNPTRFDGSLAPGSFAGTLSVNFGASITADYDFDVTIGGTVYGFGRTAAPVSTDNEFFGQFGGNSLAVSGTGTACPSGSCMAEVRGVLGGDGGTVAAISYNFGETGSASDRVYGAAGFVAPGASGSAGATTASAIAPTASNGTDWGRWADGAPDGAPGATPPGNNAVAPGLDALLAKGIQYSTEQLAQLNAFMEAQAPR